MHDWDVIVIGGGPAGSTSANFLAQGGLGTLVLERETFPRFHIGESLLPCDLPIFERLGITLDPSEYTVKAGAEFIDEQTGEHQIYRFADALPGGPAHAYQVDRAQFDHKLLQRAVAVGATVHQGEAVREVVLGKGSVTVMTSHAQYSSRYLVDASGQDAFLARRAHSVDPIEGFGRAAVFTHFSDLSEQAVAALGVEGNIKVMVIPEGWIWVIPLQPKRLSIGVVTRQGGVTQSLLEAQLSRSPLLRNLIAGATRGASHIAGNFSFHNTQPCGERWVCVGDAGCFLDPVFSSGVSLAMLSAEFMAGLLLPAFRARREGEANLMQPLGQHMARAYSSFGSLIHSFYHRRIVQNLFFADAPLPEVRAGLISILGGDVWRDDNRFQDMLLKANRWSPSAR